MEILVGTVESNEDNTKSGKLRVSFPALEDRVEIVTFTSPYYRMNAGGMVAIPEDGTQILAFHNENPRVGESTFYFHSCVISDMPRETNDFVNKQHVPLRDNDVKAKIYMDKIPYASKPVTQMFTNTAGAGLYIHRDFSTPSLSNNVTLKSESNCEVNVGPIGVQLRTAEGDSISLVAMNGGGGFLSPSYAPRSLNIETVGPQEYKCVNSDINMRIIDGGDINIENNSTGLMALGVPAGGLNPVPGIFPFSGNVRLKSRYRNIDLAALGDFSNINIVTKNAKIKISSAGDVEVHTTGRKVPLTGVPIPATGNIKLTSQQGDIELNAPTGKVKIIGGAGVDIGTFGMPYLGLPPSPIPGGITINTPTIASINATVIMQNTLPVMLYAGLAVPIPLPPAPLPGIPILPTIPTDGSVPDPQNIPVGGPSLDDYLDGSVLGGAV